ncbi:hypothetical protein QQ045_031603 [Rhodiola kirilowii]
MRRRGFPLAPPSPVPTGKGLRSSAVNDEILTDFLTTSLQIPNLKLPISFQSRRLPTLAFDFRSLLSGDRDAVERVMNSASHFGFFAIIGHGISVLEAQKVAERTAENGGEELREMNRCEAERFDFCWAGEEEDGSEFNSDMRPDPNLRKCLETAEGELVAVGKSIGEMFSKHASDFGTMQGKATSGLVILNYNVDYQLSKSEAQSDAEDNNGRYSKSALSLYLPSSQCDVLVQVGTESFVFEAGPDTIVAILGQQLECDGSEHVAYVPKKLRFAQIVDAEKSTSHPLVFSIGLNLASRPSGQHCKQLDGKISVCDQILVAALVVLLFQLALWIL